jgi:LysM repeat protein
LDVYRTISITIIFGIAALFPGCNFENAEQKGDTEAKAGRFESAIYWYEAALGTNDRETVHWKMAEIFANKLRDPFGAAYHYRRILTLYPNGSRADASRTALRRLQGSGSSPEGTPNRPRTVSTPKLSTAQQAAAEAEKEAKSKVRTYIVQPGDTLESISKKFFQTSARWKDILDANQNQLSNPEALKAGQTIILP